MKFSISLNNRLLFNSFLLYFLFIKNSLWLNKLKTATGLNAKVSVVVICVEAIIYLLLHNLHDCNFNKEEAIGLRKKLAHDTRVQKNPQTQESTLRIFMELCGSKVQLTPLHRNLINGFANPEIVYMLLLFQILCID